MKIKKFVNTKYSMFKKFTWKKLEYWWDTGLLDLECRKEFKNFEEIKKYELAQGDVIGLAMNFKAYQQNDLISLHYLKENQSKISGLGDAGLKNMKEVLGSAFTIEELEDKVDEIGYLGKKTVENIKEFVKR